MANSAIISFICFSPFSDVRKYTRSPSNTGYDAFTSLNLTPFVSCPRLCFKTSLIRIPCFNVFTVFMFSDALSYVYCVSFPTRMSVNNNLISLTISYVSGLISESTVIAFLIALVPCKLAKDNTEAGIMCIGGRLDGYFVVTRLHVSRHSADDRGMHSVGSAI